MPYDLAKATFPATPRGYDLRKAAQTLDVGRAAFQMESVKQAPAPSSDHPLAGHSAPKARYSPRSAKGRAKIRDAFNEVETDEPAVVGATRRKKGARAARKQKVAIALAKARRAGVRIPKKG